MLKLTGILISLFLIIIIFLQLPQENVGLESFASKSNIVSSPRLAQRLLYIVTGIGILVYLGVAIQLNLLNV